MKLRQYLDEEGISETTFAAFACIAVRTLKAVLRDKPCGQHTADLIVECTKGKVSYSDIAMLPRQARVISRRYNHHSG